jgi:DNA-binding protein H-NS
MPIFLVKNLLKFYILITWVKARLSLGDDLMSPKKGSLLTLSNEALCRLRDEIAEILNSRAEELRQELRRLTGDVGATDGEENKREAKRHKLVPKYRGPEGNTWCGRGARPKWLVDEINKGKKLEDFLILKPMNDPPSMENTGFSDRNIELST